MDENLGEQPQSVPATEYHPPVQTPHQNTHHKQASRKKLWLIIGGVVAVLLLGGAAYMLLGPGADKPAPAATTQTPVNKTDPPIATADPTPVTFKSTKLNIELTHRKDWTLKEASDGAIAVTSPTVAYSKADGTATTGVFTLKIRKDATDAMQANIETAIASRDSEVIGYAAPTEQQRHFTNVSYGGPKDAFSFFIVTGNTAFKTGNSFAYTLTFDSETFLIAGGYGEDKGNSLTFDSVPATGIDSDAKQQAIKIVESLKIF